MQILGELLVLQPEDRPEVTSFSDHLERKDKQLPDISEGVVQVLACADFNPMIQLKLLDQIVSGCLVFSAMSRCLVTLHSAFGASRNALGFMFCFLLSRRSCTALPSLLLHR